MGTRRRYYKMHSRPNDDELLSWGRAMTIEEQAIEETARVTVGHDILETSTVLAVLLLSLG